MYNLICSFLNKQMRMSNFNEALKVLLKHEGGFVDHSADPGGPTKYGISLRYLRSQNIIEPDINGDGVINDNDIKDLSDNQISELYKKSFWDKLSLDRVIHPRIRIMLFGMSVQMGSKQAVKLIQRALNENIHRKSSHLLDDGILGEKTLAHINKSNENALMKNFKEKCVLFYSLIAGKKPELKVFLKGWHRRINSY